MNQSLMLEIATEVAWQIGDTLENAPRAMSRWYIVRIAQNIIESGIISDQTEDIDELIATYLIEKGLKQ